MKNTIVEIFINSGVIQNLGKCFLMIFGIWACSQNEPSQNCSEASLEEIETFYQGVFDTVACKIQDVSENNSVQSVIIKNTADYEKHISCGVAAPEIDFEKYIILAIRYQHHQCAVFK